MAGAQQWIEFEGNKIPVRSLSGNLGGLINPPSRLYNSSTCIAVAFSAWPSGSARTASIFALGSPAIPLGVGCSDNGTFSAWEMSAGCSTGRRGKADLAWNFGFYFSPSEAVAGRCVSATTIRLTLVAKCSTSLANPAIATIISARPDFEPSITFFELPRDIISSHRICQNVAKFGGHAIPVSALVAYADRDRLQVELPPLRT